VNRAEALEYLDAHIGWGMEPGLERIAAFLELMGHPERSYPIIQVAGTNGKTSVSRMATMVAISHGLTTGTYTSPHLQRFEERIAINGTPASEEEFIQAVIDVKAFADIFERDRHLTYFELVTALGFSWFADQAVNAAVIEVGLGGRLDATNAAIADVAVITSIGLDHAEILGDTLEKIAGEKLGILDPESTLVVGPLDDDILKLARRTAAERGARVYEYGKDFRVEGAEQELDGWRVDLEGVFGSYSDLVLPVHGRHQVTNLAVAVAAVEALTDRRLDPLAMSEGLSVLRSPGRMEVVGHEPLVMLDGAHNPDGFRVLGSALAEEYGGIRWVAVIGAMADKDLTAMLPHLSGRVESVVATTVGADRAMSPELVAAAAGRLLGVATHQEPTPERAMTLARRLAGEGGAVLVAGSLYLVGAVRSVLLDDGGTDRNERST